MLTIVPMPIAAVYGNEVYIVDVVFDDSPPEVTKPECAKALMDNLVVAGTARGLIMQVHISPGMYSRF